MSGRRGRKRPYQLVDDMITIGSRELMEQLGVAEEQAKEVMRQIAHQVCFLNARCVIYVPAALDFELSNRDQLIWDAYQVDGPAPTCSRKFSAARVDELAAEHALTAVQIYNIIRLMKAREIAGRQGQLPGLDPA